MKILFLLADKLSALASLAVTLDPNSKEAQITNFAISSLKFALEALKRAGEAGVDLDELYVDSLEEWLKQ